MKNYDTPSSDMLSGDRDEEEDSGSGNPEDDPAFGQKRLTKRQRAMLGHEGEEFLSLPDKVWPSLALVNERVETTQEKE